MTKTLRLCHVPVQFLYRGFFVSEPSTEGFVMFLKAAKNCFKTQPALPHELCYWLWGRRFSHRPLVLSAQAALGITLIDGDTIELKNLDRQLFDARQVGMNKAQALAAKYNCRFIPEWFARGKLRHQRHDWLICLVDNHRTRRETLEVCD